jgi:hypothetical protein
MLDALAGPGPHGIRHDVVARGLEVLVRLDRDGAVAVAEQVAPPLVTSDRRSRSSTKSGPSSIPRDVT